MGLIKVPDQLLGSLCAHVISQHISYLYTFPDKKSDAEDLAIEYNSMIDSTFIALNKEIDLTTALQDVPDSLQKSWRLEFGYLRLIVDWEQKIWVDRPKVNASYEESNEHGIPGYFTINPRSFTEEVNSENYNIQNIKQILDKVYYSLWHEASHAVQHNSLKWIDKTQVRKSRIVRDNPNSSPEDRRIEYLTSFVEFDPQIKTKIYQFRQKYGNDKENILKNLSIFVGSVKMDEENPDEFFDDLKNTDIKRWKKAVKAFYKNYNIDITDRLRDIPNIGI
jgi:hypothetical protein